MNDHQLQACLYILLVSSLLYVAMSPEYQTLFICDFLFAIEEVKWENETHSLMFISGFIRVAHLHIVYR